MDQATEANNPKGSKKSSTTRNREIPDACRIDTCISKDFTLG